MTEDPEPARNISGGAAGSGELSAFEDGDETTRAAAVVERLGEIYWEKTYGGRAAFDCLVRTILSQNTSDQASQPAYEELVARYGGDDVDLAVQLAHAEQGDVADAISAAGLYNQKSETLIRIADRVLEEYGSEDEFDRFVREGDPDEVREALLSFKGVGPKTARFTIMYAAGMPFFPMDTHILRICERLGWIDEDLSSQRAHEAMEPEIPEGEHYPAHIVLVRHGREVCSARNPDCEACPILEHCPHGQSRLDD